MKNLIRFLRFVLLVIIYVSGSYTIFAQSTFKGNSKALAEDCIDFTDLYGAHVTCYYGTTTNTMRNIGVVNGRHTVMTGGTDSYTNNQLPCVPPGEPYSIRLGNSSTNAEAESIIYSYLVDTTQFSILMLRWASVLQNPGHSSYEQPRFTFKILDANGIELDAVCTSADFIASASLGWRSGTSSTLWKPWTTVGIDVSQYHGQQVRIQLTTYDCSQGAHFGYAYFTLRCAKKQISVKTCGNVDEISYSAPDGFTYSWYWQSNPNNIISTNQDITVQPNANDVLYCNVAFVENPSNCHFSLFTTVNTRWPLAQFNYHVDDCYRRIIFDNTSTISADQQTPDGSGDPCTFAYWIFGNGRTSLDYDPGDIPYNPNNTYNVTLISGISGLNGNCYDTTTVPITLGVFTPTLSGDTIVCKEDNANFLAGGGVEYLWDYQNTTTAALQVPDSGTYSVIISDTANTCWDTLQIHVRYYDDFSVDLGPDTTVCDNEGFIIDATHPNSSYRWQDGTTDNTIAVWSEGLYSVTVTNEHGCSNTFTRDMTFYPRFDVNVGRDSTLCDLATMVLEANIIGNLTQDTTYRWQDNSTNRTYEVFPNGGTYWVTVSDICYGISDTVNIDYLQTPTVFIGNDTTLCEGDPLVLDATTPTYTYYWTHNGSTNAICVPTETGRYEVVVTGYCGSTSSSVEVTFRDCDIIVPNVYTPNGDGVNDFFEIDFSDNFNFEMFTFSVHIYDRWGRLLYTSNDPKFQWDGSTTTGSMTTDGVYFWIIKFATNGGIYKELNGSVTRLSSK